MRTEGKKTQIDELVQTLLRLPRQWWLPQYNVIAMETTGLSKQDVVTEISVLSCDRRKAVSVTYRVDWSIPWGSSRALDKLLSNARAYCRANGIPELHLSAEALVDPVADVADSLSALGDAATMAPLLGHSLVDWTLPVLCGFLRGASASAESRFRIAPERQIDLAMIEKAIQTNCPPFQDELVEDWYERVKYAPSSGARFSMAYLREKYRVDSEPFPLFRGLPSPSLGKAMLLHNVWERMHDTLVELSLLPNTAPTRSRPIGGQPWRSQ